MLKAGAKIKAYDPQAMDSAKNIFDDKVEFSYSNYEILKNADCLVLLTEWNEFKNPDFNKIKHALNKPIIFDGRNQYNGLYLIENGFEYYCVGKQYI